MSVSVKIFFTFYLLVLAVNAKSQSYFANGSAIPIQNSTCYQLTPAADFQLGSVWYADKIDLSKDLDLEFELNFGNKDAGADGIVFVLQTVGNKALGMSGGGIGFEGFSPSLGIEFDVWQNNDMGDISADHIAIVKNGNVRHTGANSIATPVTALASGGNIEDGTDHLVRITWDVSLNLLEVWFDCVKRQSVTIDIRNSIFSGQKDVFWGFTSATGGANNRQIACLRNDILLQDTFAICKGETTQLNARESFDDTYTWTPTDFLDDPTSRTPECSTVVPMTYYVEYRDRCNNLFQDTVQIRIDEPFVMDEGEDTLLCDGSRYAFDLTSEYDSVRWNNGIRAQVVAWQTAGMYALRAWKGVCYDDDAFTIRVDTTPTIRISGDSIFCENELTEISLEVVPTSASILWQDGSTDISRSFGETTAINITASNECATTVENYNVREITLPSLDLGSDSTLCDGDTVFLTTPVQPGLRYRWSTGETLSTIEVTGAGQYSVEISESNLCFDYDTVTFVRVPFPSIGSLSNTLLCRDEEIILSVDNEFGTVVWDDGFEGNNFILKNREGELRVKSTNQCGADSTELYIELIECFCRVWMPNAITANGDNLNEMLTPVLDCPKLRDFSLAVYNRWGELLWETKDATKSWDATYKGQPVQSGVYFWLVEWSGIRGGILDRSTDKGILHVIR